jgi:hypothetical protein
MNTTTDPRDVMTINARMPIDVDALPTHVAQAFMLRASLVTAYKATEETWQEWADAKNQANDTNKTFRGAGRDPVAMERRRVTREREAQALATFKRWDAQHKALSDAWYTILNTLTRRDALWIYMVTSDHDFQRSQYARQIVDIDARERHKEVIDRGGATAQLWTEHSRYAGLVWRMRFGNDPGALTFYSQEEAEAWAHDHNLLVTCSDLLGMWIVFDFAG